MQSIHQQHFTQSKVIVVGGGMVGLSLSLLLAQHGIAVTLLEANRYPTPQDHKLVYHSSFDARNTALSRRTVAIYQQLVLWDQLQRYAAPIHQVHITEQGSFGRARLINQDEQVENFGQVIENAWLGQVLLDAVQKQSLIHLIEGIDVTELRQDAQQVYLKAISHNNCYDFSAALVIAADGRDSFCRQALGIGVQQHDYHQVAIVTTVQTSKPHQNIAYERFSQRGPLALLPLPGDYRRSVVWTVQSGTEQAWLDSRSDQVFLQALQHSYGHRAGKFEKTGKRFSYPLMQVLAKQQVVGRVVLMGNAAHTLHPVAGQGFNLCMRDADVLTRYLSHQQQYHLDLGNTQTLQRYEQDRAIDQHRVSLFCDRLVKGFSADHMPLRWARNIGLLAFDSLPGFKPTVAHFAMGLNA